MKKLWWVGMVILLASWAIKLQGKEQQQQTIDSQYPGLASGALMYARLQVLPEGLLLKAGELTISEKDLAEQITKFPEQLRPRMAKNNFFVLEQYAVEKLLLQEAHRTEKSGPAQSDVKTIQAHLKNVVTNLMVSEPELQKFYDESKEMVGGAPLADVKDQLKAYLLNQKRQEAVREHIRTLGQRVNVVVSADWVSQQAKMAWDNPVDKARASGKPSLVDFGANGCKPCEMMAPILDALKKKYEGQANILFVHAREEQVLASRYGIQVIPVQIFYNQKGKEVFRHVGFFPQAEIEKKLAELGVN